GGEGKTTLAAELARWLVVTRRFERAAFVSLEHVLDVRAVVAWLGDQLVPGFVMDASKEPEKAVPLLERALCERPTIVVLDNLESLLPPPESSQLGLERVYEPALLEEILRLFERLLDAGETRLVFTSREALPEPFARHRNTMRITRLDRADALKLVSDVLGEENARPLGSDAGESEEEIERLVDAVGCHASCLVLVAREVAASGVRGAADRLEELMATMAVRYGNDRERSLFASVELSLRRLPAETRRRLPRLGVFQGGANVVAIALVLGLGDEPQIAVDISQQLVGVGLAELLPYGHVRLHPALGPLLRGELSERELEEARKVWMGAMVALAEYLYQQRFRDAQLAANLTVFELPNLIGALEVLREICRAEEAVKVATFIEGLLQFLGRPLAMGRVVGIRKKAAEGLTEWGQATFEARRSEIDRLLDSGCLVEALEASRSLLQLGSAAGESAYEGAAYDLAGAYFMLGRGLCMSGAAEAALKPLSEARERFEKLGGQNGSWMAMASLGEIGDCLRNLGRLDEAAAAYEVTIQLAERQNDRRSSAVHRAQLGTVRMLQRRYVDALNAYTQACKAFEQLGELGSVAVAWHNSGMVHQYAQQYEEAEQAYLQALRLRMQLGDRPGEADSLSHLGQLLGLKGRSEDAVRFFLQEVEIRSGLDDRMREGHSRYHIAVELIKLQRYAEARHEILRAIECLKPYGHAAQMWKIFNNLHDLERAVGNTPAAERARTDAIVAFLAYRRAGGENHEPGSQLAAAVGQAITSGEIAAVAAELAQLGARPDLAGCYKVLIPVLQQILAGSRDPALASEAKLFYMDVAEVMLLLERLG
ncbi:MAG: tetratricopeptide repeat protein, partial [Thermoanaerobaculia bacterium]|nr:tetratricopeptide repeat protein [Thermoanaerobaculia bacterium]